MAWRRARRTASSVGGMVVTPSFRRGAGAPRQDFTLAGVYSGWRKERGDSSLRLGMTPRAPGFGMTRAGQRALCRAVCQLTELPHSRAIRGTLGATAA